MTQKQKCSYERKGNAMKHTAYADTAFRDTDYKDESPLNTVEKIKNILHSHGIETTETWLESSVPYCYSLRVSVIGTTFSTNGKGVTKEFALASGYGELMERLQLGYIGSDDVQKDGNFSLNDAQSVTVCAADLLSENRKWYESLSEKLRFFTGEERSPEDILMQYADADGNVSATPYFNITTSQKAYLPTNLRKDVYTANGCAAGNTMQEAIVQAISEVVERYHQIYMYYGDITSPDIPEDVLKKCDVAYSIISYIRGKGFKVYIKDCSLSEKFPVIGVTIIDTKTGKYHTHFGAYPIFEIALERALTESFQGRTISKIAKFDDFRYGSTSAFNLNTLVNELVKGVSEKFPRFFVGNKKFDYNDKMGFSGKNSKELLTQCIDYFKQKGLDILIRDCSCLGFPTYQVLVPGYSEVFPHRLSPKFNDRRYGPYAKKVLRNPSTATMDDMIGYLMHLTQTTKMSSNISEAHGFSSGSALSLNFSDQENLYMMYASLAYINYAMMKYGEVIKYLDKMIKSPCVKNEGYLICLKRYLSLLINKYDQTEIKEILEFFHAGETCEELYACLDANKNPLEGFTLHCDGVCDENCILRDSCCQKRVHEIASIITEKTKLLDFDVFVKDLNLSKG